LLGSWTANGLSTPQGITTNGTDIWIVDDGSNKVFRYAGAATKLSGNANATSSFSLNSSNANAKGIVTNGTHFWVVNDNSTDKVFKYTLAGSLVGSWTIDAANGSPTGITIDPTDVDHLWIVDSADDAVYRYNSAVGRSSASQNAAHVFQLAGLNSNPQGIADPPPAGGTSRLLTDVANVFAGSPTIASRTAGTKDRAFADLSPLPLATKGRRDASNERTAMARTEAIVPASFVDLELTRLATKATRAIPFGDELWQADEATQFDATDAFFSEFDSECVDEALELAGVK
jgi:hypothetical protein